MNKQLETSVEDYLVDRVEKELGGMALKGAVPGRRFLDRIVILPGGTTIYVECKRPKGGIYSAHQDETLDRLAKLGHRTARVKTKAEVDQLLEAPAPQPNLRGDLYDAEAFMADGEIPMTAAENVLAWLLVEKIGVVDDIGYSPNDAREIIVANIDQAAKQLVEGGELLLQAEAAITDLTKLLDAAKDVIASASDTYKKRNGHRGSFEDDSGEKCWIVPFDAFEGLRSAVNALAVSAPEVSGNG